jgi:hypothetical protein
VRERKRGPKIPKSLVRFPSPLLPQTRPLNSHFSQTIFLLTVLCAGRSSSCSLKTSTLHPGKNSASAYVNPLPPTSTHFRLLSLGLPPILHLESRGMAKRERVGGAAFIGPPLHFCDWLFGRVSPPTGHAPARGPWQPPAPDSGRQSPPPFPSAGGKVR